MENTFIAPYFFITFTVYKIQQTNIKYSTDLEAAEEVIILVGGEVVLGLVPVTARPRHVVAGPGHVLQQGRLPVIIIIIIIISA